MPDLPLQRGSVVLCEGRYHVVWEVCGAALVLLPVLRPRQRFAGDVALELADLVACGVPIGGAVVRPRRKAPVAAAGHVAVGAVPGPVMCRVVLGVIRDTAFEAEKAKWADDRRHRARVAAERCVNLVA